MSNQLPVAFTHLTAGLSPSRVAELAELAAEQRAEVAALQEQQASALEGFARYLLDDQTHGDSTASRISLGLMDRPA